MEVIKDKETKGAQVLLSEKEILELIKINHSTNEVLNELINKLWNC